MKSTVSKFIAITLALIMTMSAVPACADTITVNESKAGTTTSVPVQAVVETAYTITFPASLNLIDLGGEEYDAAEDEYYTHAADVSIVCHGTIEQDKRLCIVVPSRGDVYSSDGTKVCKLIVLPSGSLCERGWERNWQGGPQSWDDKVKYSAVYDDGALCGTESADFKVIANLRYKSAGTYTSTLSFIFSLEDYAGLQLMGYTD